MSKRIFIAFLLFASNISGAKVDMKQDDDIQNRAIENFEEYDERFGVFFRLPNLVPGIGACSRTTIAVTARCTCGSSTCNVGQTCGVMSAPNTCINMCPSSTPTAPGANLICACPGGICTACGAGIPAPPNCNANMPICTIAAGNGVCQAQ